MIREKIGSLLLRGFEALTPSAIRESEIRHRQLFEDNPFPMWLYDRLTLQFLAVNNAAIQHYGYSRDEFLSMTLADIRPTEDHAALFRYVAKQHSPRFPTSVWRHLRKDGSLIDVEITAYAMVFAGRPAEIVLAHDVTERMRVQADSAIISEIIQGAAITNDLVETIKLIHGCIGRSLYAENFYVALYDRRTEMLSIPFCVDKYDDIAPPMKLGRGLTAYVLRTEKPVILHGDDIDRLVETGEVNAVGTKSAAWLGVPLRTADEVTGAIVVQHYEDPNAYNDRSLEFLTTVGAQIAMSIERTRSEERLRNSQATLAEAQTIAQIGSFTVDFRTGVTEWSDALWRIYGLEPEDKGLGLNDYIKHIHPDDRERVTLTIEDSIKRQEPHTFHHRIVRPDGTIRVVMNSGKYVFDTNNRPAKMTGIQQDITERQELEDKLSHMALHDPLTKLANRALFADRVEHALTRRGRKREAVAVLFLDLDNFKNVNDTLGHAAGDELLVAVAARLQSCLRSGDTAARLGGDEFAILVEDADDADGAMHVAERIQDILRPTFTSSGKEITIGTSIGIATAVLGVANAESLLRNADVAMYTAKSQGKNRYAVFETEMHESIIKRIELENEMRRAIENNEFVVHYQPIIDLVTGRLTGMEALTRWEHPSRGLVPPMDFIQVAEETGLIISLGEWILETACRQTKIWQHQYGCTSLYVAVNISGRQFHHESIVETIKRALTTTGLPAENLVLEITETTMLQNTALSAKKLADVKALGVRLAIDDFGTGYSSLSYLQQFPVDILKIDKSFIDRISLDEEGAAVTRAIITMSDTLRLHTVAEGIETSAQTKTLQSLGCELGQGYHFAKPLCDAEMSDFIRSSVPGKQDLERRPRLNFKCDRVEELATI